MSLSFEQGDLFSTPPAPKSEEPESKRTAILLINLGTPKAPTTLEVWRFLSQFLFDPCVVALPKLFRIGLQAVLPFRAKRVAKLYKSIWLNEGSPLQVYSDRLGQRLQNALEQGSPLSKQSPSISVHVAMTYGSPNILSTINKIMENNVNQIIVIPLFPQYSRATTRAIWNKICNAFRDHYFVPSIYFIHEYANDDLYINAIAESINQYWIQNGRSERLLFSFHGVPKRYVSSIDNYPMTCRRLAHRVAKKLKIPENFYEISFQSRFGPAPWITPYTDQQLRHWAKNGTRSVDVVSPSFAVDCLETLEELKVQMRHLFLSSGGEKYQYIPALNDNPMHVAVLKGLIQKFF